MSVFTKAIQILRARGLNKGNFTTYDEQGVEVINGPVCTMGACGLAERGRAGFPSSDTLMTMEHVLNEKYETRLLAAWNDAPSRTLDDVINFLLDCEAECEDTANDAEVFVDETGIYAP
jgi:hypothetical protein